MDNPIIVSRDIFLQQLQESDSEELFKLVEKNRTYLRNWLPWLDKNQTKKDTLEFIKTTITQFQKGLGPQFKIHFKEELSGVIGFHPFDLANQIAEIGYWLSEDKQGNGIMTQCCSALIKLGFEEFGLNRIQIPAAENNKKSRSVPERLNFKFEGLIRNRENLYGQYVDHAMYSILKKELQESGI